MIDLPITTDRLTIRRFAARDLDGFLAFLTDPESTRYLTFSAEETSEEGARGMFDYVVSAYDTPEVVHAYAIVETRTGDYIGSCGFAPEDEGVVECYFGINQSHRGQGFATEALAGLLAALASQTEVRAYCHPENLEAQAVARSAGMIAMGRSRGKTSPWEGEVFASRRSS